jgi:enediyne biosynthesis protein E4
LHFGLGQATHVASIEVRWPSGRSEVFPGVAADQIISLKEGSGSLKGPQ